MQTLQVAILAAGEGKRMRSTVPKVLQPLAGRPLLSHVLTTARSLAPRAICIVDSRDTIRSDSPMLTSHGCDRHHRAGPATR